MTLGVDEQDGGDVAVGGEQGALEQLLYHRLAWWGTIGTPRVVVSLVPV